MNHRNKPFKNILFSILLISILSGCASSFNMPDWLDAETARERAAEREAKRDGVPKGKIQDNFKLFGSDTKVRFRPSYFPFTEPSAEVDIFSEKTNKWLEILGCGIVNPVVLENCNIDSEKFSGFAFGLGIERIAMLKHEIIDIREFYKSNLDFLEQFK